MPPMQIIVLDKLDYCATLRNLDSVKGHKNLKASMPAPTPVLTGPIAASVHAGVCAGSVRLGVPSVLELL